jgi:hypothetical protein
MDSYVTDTYQNISRHYMVFTCKTLDPQQSAEAAYKELEEPWRAKNFKIVRVDWSYTAQPAGNSQGSTPPGSPHGGSGGKGGNAPSGNIPTGGEVRTVYVYCYSAQEGGMNNYYSDVFPAEIKVYPGGMGAGLVDAATVKRIEESFYGFLAKQNYTFKRGGCEAVYDEQLVKTNKHTRACGGNPCSNCGKAVETGWKYSSPNALN